MKKRLMLVAVAVGLSLAPAATVAAQVPDVPGIDPAKDVIDESGGAATARRGRIGDLPGADALPDNVRNAPARATGTGQPSRLPATGSNTTALALDGLTLLGAGSLLIAVRRRLAGSSV